MAFSRYAVREAGTGTGDLHLSELIGALSHALDMTEGQPEGHSVRSCWIGMKVGEALGFDRAKLADLYYTLLLKDLGCSSNAARICALYLTDDISFKRNHKTISTGTNAVLRFVFSQTGVGHGLSERFRTLLHVVSNGHDIKRELFEARCHRGADIAARMRFSQAVQDGIRNLDEHWDGWGSPRQLQGDEIPEIANIALLSQVADVFSFGQGSRENAISEVRSRSDTWFSPAIVDAFLEAQERPGFWASLKDPDLDERVQGLDPMQDSCVVDEDWLDDIAAAFADVVDAKSPFTADHSKRVALYADMIAEEMGLSQEHRRWLGRAALLHDIGKLSVSNRILDKPGKLDSGEWDAVKKHSFHSQRILERISVFRDIAPIAGAHHERLDGAGYPYGLRGDEICLETRILTVADVFDALSADRPYRTAMPMAQVLGILEKDIGTAFDGDCVNAMRAALGRMPEYWQAA